MELKHLVDKEEYFSVPKKVNIATKDVKDYLDITNKYYSCHDFWMSKNLVFYVASVGLNLRSDKLRIMQNSSW